MSFVNVETVLASAVATSGTFTVSYPSPYTGGSFQGATRHFLFVNQTLFAAPADFTVSFGAASATVTWLRSITLPAGTRVAAQFDQIGSDVGKADEALGVTGARTGLMTTVYWNLGQPITADADGVSASQSVTVATTPLATIAGALASGGVATFDVPRNVVAAWTGTAVVTVTGRDEYGNLVVESSASGTSFTGKKAFKTVTRVSFSADVTGATVGSGVVLGLPAFLGQTGLVFRELQDGALATAGTLVVGDNAAATATTGDVRGTYNPNSAPNGTRFYSLIAAVAAPANIGRAQFAG